MAIGILSLVNDVVYSTAKEIVDQEIPTRIAGVLNALINSSFQAVNDLCVQVQDLTKKEP